MGNFSALKVVAGAHIQIPLLRKRNASRKAYVGRYLMAISHTVFVELGLVGHQTHIVVEGDVPGNVKFDVAVVAFFNLAQGLLVHRVPVVHDIVHRIQKRIVFFFVGGRQLFFLLVFFFLFKCVGTNAVTEAQIGVVQTGQAFVLGQFEAVDPRYHSCAGRIVGSIEGVRVKAGTEADVGPQYFGPPTHADGTQFEFVGQKVVGGAEIEGFQDGDFSEAGGVAVAPHLHLHLVTQTKTQGAGFAATRGTVKGAFEAAVIVSLNAVVVFVVVLHPIVVAVLFGTEVGTVTETYTGGHHVAHGINLVAKQGPVGAEKGIDLGTGAYAHIVFVSPVEPLDGVADHDPAQLLVVVFFDGLKVPAFVVVEVGRKGKEVEQFEVHGKGNAVAGTITPVVGQCITADAQLTFFRLDVVFKVAGVAHAERFVPFFTAYTVLFLERVNPVHGHRKVGQGKADGCVSAVLRVQGVGRQVKRGTWKLPRIGNA